MDSVGGLLAVISTLISSVALVGVMIGLLLQVRQIRISNLQTFRASNAELIRMSIDYPESFTDPTGTVPSDQTSARRWVLMNWQMQHLWFGYSIRAVRESALRLILAGLFVTRFRREWWEYAHDSYKANAYSRRERRFVEIVEMEYQSAITMGPNPTTDEESSSLS